jgi:hypothetical protein
MLNAPKKVSTPELMHEFVPVQAKRLSGNTRAKKNSCNTKSPAKEYVLNICVKNRAIYFALSCWAAQSEKNIALFIAVHRAGKSVEITANSRG